MSKSKYYKYKCICVCVCVCTQVAAALLEKLIKGEKKAKKTSPRQDIFRGSRDFRHSSLFIASFNELVHRQTITIPARFIRSRLFLRFVCARVSRKKMHLLLKFIKFFNIPASL